MCGICGIYELSDQNKIDKKQLERLIGLAIWFTTGALWLRPWLQMEELTASMRMVASIPKIGGK